MSDGTKKIQLIVQQKPLASPELDSLVQVLQDEHGLDAYTAKYRLTGSGKALFGTGSKEKTDQLAALLRNHGYNCWEIQQTQVLFSPLRLRELAVSSDSIELICREKSFVVSRGSTVVAVLADVSGQIKERCIRRHMTQRNYRKAMHMTSMDQEEMVRSVLKGKPLVDLYLLDPKGQPQAAVRIFPGRFNAQGLGDRMTPSALRNLQIILRLVRECAGRFVLHADFGLGSLPGCQIKTLDGVYLESQEILESLTRFGWLMCDLEQDRPEAPPGVVDPALAAVAVALGQPALVAAVASGNVEAVPGLNEVVRELQAAIHDDTANDEKGEEEESEQWLPLPPERPESKISGRMLLSALGTFFAVAVFMLLSQDNTPLLRSVAKYSMKAGLIPGLLSLGFCWAGFYFIRLKRKIENTPTSRIRSMAMGLVEVHGRATRKYALVSPVSQSPCIYYRLRKYKKDSNNHWTLKSDRHSGHVPFMVEDNTGQVTVDPLGAIVRPKISRTGFPGEATLAFQGVSAEDQDEKWVEDVIYEGAMLYVLGFAQPLREKRKSLRERTVEKLRDLKLDRQALHRYDTDGDGQISEDEWQMARSDAEQDALKAHLSDGIGRKRQEEHAVIARSSQRSMPFVIAEAASEARLARNYGLFSVSLLITGLATAGFALFKLLEFLGA